MVAALGNGERLAHALADPGLDRERELLHLLAGVVDVVLALDVHAGGSKQARDGIPDGRCPRAHDVQGARRVRAHKLDLDARALAGLGAAVPRALADGLAEHAVVPWAGEPEVDEPGASDLDGLDERGVALERRDDLGRDLSRVPTKLLADNERDARPRVPVRRVARGRDVRPVGREPELRERPRERLLQFVQEQGTRLPYFVPNLSTIQSPMS